MKVKGITEIPISVHFVTDEDGKKYLEINDVIELIEYAMSGVLTGKLDIQDMMEQLKQMAE